MSKKTTPDEQVNVYASPLPFSNMVKPYHQLPGTTLEEIVNNVIPVRIKGAGIAIVAIIDGNVINPVYWPHITPEAGQTVNIKIMPQGGGGGKKNPIATLLSIAVLVAAPYASAAVLGNGIIASTALGAKLITTGLTAAFGALGKLAVSALAPPPKPSNAGTADRVQNPTESPTQFIEGASNALDPFGVIPVNLGVNRMFPKQCARAYTETENNDQYVRQLFCWGYGPGLVLEDIKIGETLLTEFSDYEIEHKLNADLNAGTDLYTRDVFQEDFNVLLNQVDGYATRTTQLNVDEAIIDVTFPQGLAQYNEDGARNGVRVQLELQYALTGESPQVWSPGASSFETLPATSITLTDVSLNKSYSGDWADERSRTDIISINKYDGTLYAGTFVPANNIRVASATVTSTRNPVTGVITNDLQIVDDRAPALFGVTFEDSASFVPSKSGLTVFVSSGGMLVNDLDIYANQKEALRKSVRVKFPSADQYDIRIRRLTADSASDQVFDDVYLTAIKSIKYQAPVNCEEINGTALRLKATDQLNGPVERLNAVVGTIIPDYDPALNEWVERVTDNPASLYRYILQGAPNALALPDDQIDLDDLADWWIHCDEQDYSYNRVIDYETSVDAVLRDIASAGAASPAIVDGKRTIAIDRAKSDIVQIITPRNSYGYSGEMTYPELPHAFRVQFRNADNGYAQDERVVYDDGFDENNATIYESMELQSCTSADLAFKTGRRHIAAVRLRPETHSWFMDMEHLIALRGNRVKLVHDVPLVGVGDGRIKTIEDDGNSPALITGFTLDDTVTFPSSIGTYYVRIRKSDGTQLYKELTGTVQGDATSFDFATPFNIDDAPAVGDLAYIVEAGQELDLIITRIEPGEDLTAKITAINYDEAIFTAENVPIPAFNSNATIPLSLIRPEPPKLLNSQNDESVMLQNSDGTFTPRAIFTLENINDGQIFLDVKIRVSGSAVFTNADILEASPTRLVLTGLEDGKYYDIHLRYRRSNSNVISLPLQLNNYLFVGASGTPPNPTNFRVNIDNDKAYFKWDPGNYIDHSHSIMKFSPVFSGATYGTALVLENEIYENRLELPFIPGTYFLKNVDLSGNESDDAAVIITFNPGNIENAVALVQEHSTFTGVKDNTTVVDGKLQMGSTDSDGYYYFANNVDLGGVYPAFVSATILANGAYVNNIFDFTDIFAETDIFGVGNNNVFDFDDIFAIEDIFGIGNDAWAVSMEYRTTQTDPNNSPAGYGAWTTLEAGTIEFWGIEFRIKLSSLQDGISPEVSELSVLVDMPDRIIRGEDITVPVDGLTVTFNPGFKEIPAVAITIQDGAVDDRIEYVSKSASEIEFKIYNGTLAAYVERTVDYIASGYGREI